MAPPPVPTFDRFRRGVGRTSQSQEATAKATEAAVEAAEAPQQQAAATQQAVAEATVAQETAPFAVREARAAAEKAEIQAQEAAISLQKLRTNLNSSDRITKAAEAREILMREINNLVQAKELSRNMFGASGVGHNLTQGLAGSPAATIQGLLDPITANEAFTRLSEMRSDPGNLTGGALGNVTERELDLLKASGGYIPPTADDKAFQSGIDTLLKRRIQVLSRLGADFEELANMLGPQNIELLSDEISAYRFAEGDRQALVNYTQEALANDTFDPTEFAGLMGTAYYYATGNMPNETWMESALENARQVQEDGQLTRFNYSVADEAARRSFASYAGEVKPQEISLGEALGGAVFNFVPSAFELAYDTVYGLTLGLPDTIEGAVDIIAGATGISEDDEAYQATKDYFVDRYGSFEGFKRAIRSDPASILADVAGIATLGGVTAAKLAGGVNKITQIRAFSDAARKADAFTRAAARIDPLVMVGKGAGVAGKKAKELGMQIPAAVSGTTSANLRFAEDAGRRGSPSFLENLEGRSDPMDIVKQMDRGLQELYRERSAAYSRRMNQLQRNPETLDFSDIDAAIENTRDIGSYRGVDISAAAEVWNKIDSKVAEFRELGIDNVEGFDAMKRAVGNIRDNYQRGTAEYRAANEVYKSISNTITRKAPIYADIMRDYAATSAAIADARSVLGVDAPNANSTLTRMMRQVGGRAPRGTTALDLLENTEAGRGITDRIAGLALSGTEPPRLTSNLLTFGGAAAGAPEATAAMFASPQRVGRGMYNVGRAEQALANLPPAKLVELASRYGPAVPTTVRAINPALQPMFDPLDDLTDESKEMIFQRYSPDIAPSPRKILDIEQYNSPAPAPVPEIPSQLPESNLRVVDPKTGELVDPEDVNPTGYAMGGLVKKYAEGGEITPTFSDRVRAVAGGLTFRFNDEIEAGLRALAQLNPSAYRREVAKIRAEQRAYEEANPGEALALELGGAILPAVGLALVPGGQMASGARLAALADKYPRAAQAAYRGAQRLGPRGAAAIPVAGGATAYGVGAADTMGDIPRSVAEEMAFGLGMYGAVPAAKAGYRKVRGR